MTGDGKGHRPVDPRARSKKQSWKEAARERQQFWLMPISFEELQRRLEAGENVAGATAPMGTDGTWGRAHLWISLPASPLGGSARSGSRRRTRSISLRSSAVGNSRRSPFADTRSTSSSGGQTGRGRRRGRAGESGEPPGTRAELTPRRTRPGAVGSSGILGGPQRDCSVTFPVTTSRKSSRAGTTDGPERIYL